MSKNKNEKKVIEAEVAEEETVAVKEKPEKKAKDEKGTVKKVINVVLWVILFAWMAIVLVDYYKTTKEEKPVFCFINNKTTTYDDGTVDSCMGLGYKIYNYNRKSYKAIQFGPFWISEHNPEKDK